ncbi:response regulator transcription factor [Nocardioides sp. T2.26MG-1]|uniref:response regulator transcription factor n=1 Tax=Nocardioides sp. T2.26MG-1 TaxID=3041166 RepID=UPI002540C38A|nr:response regulator transcription factor [Nocardioides sp. T2.26MG-1]
MTPDDRRRPRSRALTVDRSARVLVVDDEPAIVDLVGRTLRVAGLEVATATRVSEAADVAATFAPELAVLDVMLPDGSGLDLCHTLRTTDPDIGIVFLTARDGVDDRLNGFALGGDDYVSKPFSVAELVARVNAVLRRRAAGPGADRLAVADLELDDRGHEVTRAGLPVELSPTEYRLLRYLMLNAGQVLSKEQILAQVWQYEYTGDVGVVEKFVSQLRRKVDTGHAPLIGTVRGFGYVLRAPR